MKRTLWTMGLAIFALLASATSQAALVTLTFSSGTSVQSVFTISTDTMLAEQNATRRTFRLDLESAEYFTAGSSISFDTTGAYYGPDTNGETIEFRAGSNGETLQLGSLMGGLAEFTFDELSNEVTYSGMYNDPVTSFTDFSFSGTDFDVDLTTLQAAGYEGFISTDSLNTFYTVDSLNVSISGVSAVPLPAAAWLFGTGLVGLFGISRRRVK